MKSLTLIVYFMTLLGVGSESSGGIMCLPCPHEYMYLCQPEENQICINDTEQFLTVLNKTRQYVADDVQRREKEKCEDRQLHNGITFFVFFCGLCMISLVICAGFVFGVRLCNACWSTRRSVRDKDLEKALTDTDKSKGTSKGEILQQSLFKKTIDATLLIPEIGNLGRCMGSVGILYWNNFGRGTVVRIGSNFILTCWHVIEPIVLPAGKIDHWGKASVAMDFESLKNKDIVNVDFDSEDKRSDRCRFGFKPKACFLDKKMDICILELDADQKDLPVPIDFFRDIQSIGMKTAKRFVHVIGQHPDKARIVLDTGCKIILPDDEKVKSAKKWIKKNKQIIVRHGISEKHIMESYDDVFETNQNLILDTFMEFGASGGAVVTITPDGKVALVAILMGGLPAWFWNKYSQECGFPSELRMEVGCPISQILGSNEWIESERNRIFGSEVNERMDTDEPEIHIQTRIGRASYRNEEVVDMDTD